MKPSLLLTEASIAAEKAVTFSLERAQLPSTVFQRGLAGAEEAVVQLFARDADPAADLVIEDCEDAWNEYADANVTATADGATKKVGTNSAKLAVALGAAAGAILATEKTEALDLRPYDQIKLWVKSSVNANAGDLQLLLDNTAQCASPVLTLNLPALTAGQWKHCVLTFDPTTVGLDAIVSVGVKMVTDLGAFDLFVDDVRAEQAWNDVVQGGTTLKLDVNNSLVRLDQPGHYRLKCLAAAGRVQFGQY